MTNIYMGSPANETILRRIELFRYPSTWSGKEIFDMTYRGRVENGTIVLDEAVELPEGAKVKVDLCDALTVDEGQIPTLYERLKSVIGKAEGLPTDASVNIDHYLYGNPKQ
jgi:hypothetical protein